MEKWGKYIQIPANIMLIVAVVFTVLALVMPNMAKEAYTGDFLTERFNENWVLIEESQKRTPLLQEPQRSSLSYDGCSSLLPS